MNLVKEYNGVKIFVSVEGEFYCDVNTNSSDYRNKTFASSKLQSIEKAIDNFNEIVTDGNIYYNINIFDTSINSLRVIKKMGNRLFFNDGTNSANYSRKLLYPKSIDESPQFKELELILEKSKQIQMEINRLYTLKKELDAEASKKLMYFNKVKPC